MAQSEMSVIRSAISDAKSLSRQALLEPELLSALRKVRYSALHRYPYAGATALGVWHLANARAPRPKSAICVNQRGLSPTFAASANHARGGRSGFGCVSTDSVALTEAACL